MRVRKGGKVSPAVAAPLARRGVPGFSVVLISPDDLEITLQGISVRHLDRLLDGLLLATLPRVDWARLLPTSRASSTGNAPPANVVTDEPPLEGDPAVAAALLEVVTIMA
jgi:hypothetical protein